MTQAGRDREWTLRCEQAGPPKAPSPLPSIVIRTHLPYRAPWPLPQKDTDASASFIRDLLTRCLSDLGYRSQLQAGLMLLSLQTLV